MTKVDENIKTAQNMLSGIVERCYVLEEENETLKDKIEFLTNCLDDRDKSIELLKEELEQYKKQYKHTMGGDYIDEDLYDLDC